MPAPHFPTDGDPGGPIKMGAWAFEVLRPDPGPYGPGIFSHPY